MAFEPPPYPPSLLNREQLCVLGEFGYLPLDLPPSLETKYQELFKRSSDFFNLTREEKNKAYPPSHGTENGYYHVTGEKEYITFRSFHHADSELEIMTGKLWQEVATLLHGILGGLSNLLGIPPEAWNPVLENSLVMPASLHDCTKSLLRMFKYLPNSGVADPHTDNGLLTLCVGSGEGLQVWTRSEGSEDWCWKDAGRSALLIGSTLQGLSFKRVRAGYHRVLGNPTGRSSIVFTLRPSTKNQLDLAPFGGQGTISMKDLWEEVTGGKYNVNAHQYVRDMQKENQIKRAAQESKSLLK